MNNPLQNIQLSAVNRDSAVMLVFWATWCPSCAEEVPVLNEWVGRFQAEGFKILAVNVEETREDVKLFQQTYPMNYSVVLDEAGDVTRRFGVSGVPTTVFLAKGGEIRYYGFALPPNIENLVNQS